MTKIINESGGPQGGVTLALLCEEVRGWFDGVPEEQRYVHTALPGLSFIRFFHPTEMGRGLLSPSLCLVLQGGKKILLGKAVTAYGGGSYVLSAIDLPITGQVADASPATPYLGMKIELDANEIAALIIDMDIGIPHRAPESTGAYVEEADAALQDAFLRLVRLLKTPEDSAVLSPLVKREIFYRLLKAKSGAVLYQAVVAHANDRGVHQAILWIKDHFNEPMRVDALAKIANMSASVGYQSPSQFSREYRRYFGFSPLRDRAGLRVIEE